MPKRTVWTQRQLWIAAVALMSACSAPLPLESEASERGEVSVTTQPLQLAYGFAGYVQLVLENERNRYLAARSSAVLRLRDAYPDMPHATCGATFVSPHFAITAAHCVPHRRLDLDWVEVEEQWIKDDLDLATLIDYATVSVDSGAWDNGSLGNYSRSVVWGSCRVVRRCSEEFGHERCPLGDGADVDIALIHCPLRDRSDHALTMDVLDNYWGVPRDIDDRERLNVSVWWYHEVLDLPAHDDGSVFWERYGSIAEGTVGVGPNWNYHYAKKHELMPLVSRDWPDGTRYQSLAQRHGFETANWADVPGCHGTSGSGVFIGDAAYLLGPLVGASSASGLGNRLCADMEALGPGRAAASYVPGAVTGDFVENSPEVVSDRGL